MGYEDQDGLGEIVGRDNETQKAKLIISSNIYIYIFSTVSNNKYNWHYQLPSAQTKNFAHYATNKKNM